MSKSIENLVPPLDLCRKISGRAFANSIYVRADVSDTYCPPWPRNGGAHWIGKTAGVKFCPAPTYEEIMNAIRKLKCERLICSMQPVGWSVVCWLNGECHIEVDRRAVLAALKVWFELKGIKYDAR